MTWRNAIMTVLASAGGILLAAVAVTTLRAALQARDTARQVAELVSSLGGRHARVDADLEQLRGRVSSLELWRASVGRGHRER